MDGTIGSAAEFLTRHRETIEAENENRRQAGDAAAEWDEKFTQPWNEAWESFGKAIESTYSKAGDPETTAALVDAIRRIVDLAKGTYYEDLIPLAAERCQRLHRMDPTGKEFHLCDIADRTAILTILQAALDDTASIEELAGRLLVSHPFVGSRCKREVENAEQIVTLQAGLPKQSPASNPSAGTAESIEQRTPSLDKETPEYWAKAGQLKQHKEAAGTKSLREQRSRGKKTGDSSFGVCEVGRIWRKDGRDTWYYVPSLVSCRDASEALIADAIRLTSTVD